MKLQYPFDYYWKKYNEGNCPFCNDSEINYMENLDVIYCSIYGGYLSISQDDVLQAPKVKANA
jgi:hypothetical protein